MTLRTSRGSYERGFRDLELRFAEPDRETMRLDQRRRECNVRRAALHHLLSEIGRWAADQSPPVQLPGDVIAQDEIERWGR